MMPPPASKFDGSNRYSRFGSVLGYVEELEREWLGVIGQRAEVQIRDAIGTMERPGVDYCDRCGVSIAHGREDDSRPCSGCLRRRFAWQTLVRLGEYDGALRECIHLTKFTAWPAMGFELGRRLGAQILASPVEVDVVVPIPTPVFHRFRRRIDHTAVLAQGVSSVIRRPVVQALVKSSRRPQQTVATSARRANVRGSFSQRRWSSVAGCRVLLVDDVATTGSTLKEACAVLKSRRAPASIDVGIVAVAGGVD